MDDNFLYQQRPAVRKDFADNLYRRISRQEEKSPNKLSAQVWKFALASVLGISFLVALSGPARAGILKLIQSIAGFTVEETETAPTFPPVATVYTYTPQPLPAALQDLPFSFAMPAYVPGGYVLSSDVVVAESKAWVSLQWANGSGTELNLLVQQDGNLSIPAGAGSAEEIQINGEPALLLRGWWSADGSGMWDADRNMLQLYWRHGTLIYSFEFWNLPADVNRETYVQELIRVAESIP